MEIDFDKIRFNGPEYAEHLKKLRTDPDYLKLYKDHTHNKNVEYWKNLKPFNKESDIPTLPKPLDDFYINKLIELGAIPKLKLKNGVWYYGNYRNSSFGKWNSDKQKFDIIRYKFCYMWDDCNHFEDDDGFALFVPLREATLEEIKNEETKKDNNDRFK